MNIFATTIPDGTIITAIAALVGAIVHLYYQSDRHRARHEKTKDRVARLENAIASCPVENCPLQPKQGPNGQPVISYCLRRRLRESMVKAAVLALCFLSVGCTVHPIATAKGVSMGGSFGTKSKGHYARYDGPFGRIEVGNTENDETLIPRAYITGTNIKAGLSSTASMFRSGESTKRILSGHEVDKTAIKSAADVQKTAILNPILPE